MNCFYLTFSCEMIIGAETTDIVKVTRKFSGGKEFWNMYFV